jgi:hypothetical protein
MIRVDPAASARLFVEAPDPWFLLAGPDATPLPETDQTGSNLARFDVQVLQRPPQDDGPVPLTLTLTAGRAGVETRITLDGSLLAR